jgi:hypothetical protein
MTDLAQVIADMRGDAAVLRRAGHGDHATYIEQRAADVERAAEDYLVFLSEPDARLRSGWSAQRLRRHFPDWRDEGNAEMRGRTRYFRALVIPRRPDLAAAREAGRRGDAA